ncbi:hypothetical protein [Fusobacterium necrophorum]|uniref:hypothetical protein n=1 Tax=Fusobacterium necrophorum TaxID=859 RepID=UPI00373AF382
MIPLYIEVSFYRFVKEIFILSKPVTVILSLIYEQPLNAYELIKTLHFMNVKQWYDIANSTVYATIKTLEKSPILWAWYKKIEICLIKRFIELPILGYKN